MKTATRKRAFLGILILASAFLVSAIAAGDARRIPSQQTADDLYQAAMLKKEAEGDLAGAIRIFQEILAKFSDKRDVAARAQLQIGLCHQKLGNDEAEKAFQKVIDNFPEQSDAVREARQKLAALIRAQNLVEQGRGELTIRKVWAGDLEGLGRISPDGRSLACTDWMTGDLSILDVTTGKMRHLTDKGSWEKSREFALIVAWSPDGKQIAYGWWEAPDPLNVELRVISLDNPVPRTVYKAPHPDVEVALPFGWTPDGKSILTMFGEVTGPSQVSPQGKLGLISVADGSAQILKNLGPIDFWQGGIFSLGISPDGRSIAYSYQTGDPPHCDIFLLSTNGRTESVLVEHPAHDSFLGWAPDGKSILFSSDRRGTLDAYVLRVEDGRAKGQPELIKTDIGFTMPQGISRDGSFFYTLEKGARNVYVVQFDPDQGRILDQPAAPIHHLGRSSDSPAYSPDGKYLAFISERGFQFNILPVLCIRSLETGKDREFHPSLSGPEQLRWSPDGSSILFLAAAENDHVGIFTIDVGTGSVKTIFRCELPSGQQTIESADWSRDGKSIFYVYRDSTEKLSRLLVRDLENGSEKEIFRAPKGETRFGVTCLGDGKRLAMKFSSWESTLKPVLKEIVLKIMPVEGGEPRELYTFEGTTGSGPIDGTSDGKFIYAVVKVGEDPKSLWRVSVDNGEAENLGFEMTRIFQMSLHPDGRRIAVSSQGPTIEKPELWVMENFLPVDKEKK